VYTSRHALAGIHIIASVYTSRCALASVYTSRYSLTARWTYTTLADMGALASKHYLAGVYWQVYTGAWQVPVQL